MYGSNGTSGMSLEKPVTWIHTAFGYALYAVICSLPFNSALNSLSILLLTICWLAEGDFMGKLQRLKERPVIFLFLGFYACFLVGMLYTDHVDVGRFNLEKKMSFIALPLVLGTSQAFTKSMRDRALLCFASSSVLAAVICFGRAIYTYFFFQDASYFVHDKLASTIALQAPYFGMFLALTIIILVNYWVDTRDRLRLAMTVGLSMVVLFAAGFIVLLSARTATVFLLAYGLAAPFMLGNMRHRRLVMGLGIVAIALMSLLIANSSYLQERFIKPLISDISVTSGGEETGLSIRMVKWNCSLKGFMEAPLLGVGTGDAEGYLVSCYEKENFWGMYPQYRFNAHNQYLETALTLGLMGLVTFLGSIFFPAMIALKKRDYLCLSFLALFAFCCITESVLERQWGVVFFTLFVSLLTFSSNSMERSINHE